MSSQKGNVSRTRKQKHQNSHAFKNDMHDTSGKTKTIKGLNLEGLCKRCKEIIDWKIKYKKYKPLTKPATCVRCKGKTVKRAYYIVCQPCAAEAQVCAKCNVKKEIEVQPVPSDPEKMKQDAELQFELKQLTERQRRKYYRHIEKGETEDQALGAAAGQDAEDESEEDEDEGENIDDCDETPDGSEETPDVASISLDPLKSQPEKFS